MAKVLLRLDRCAGWSLLSTYAPKVHFQMAWVIMFLLFFRYTFPLLLNLCAQGWVNQIVLTSSTDVKVIFQQFGKQRFFFSAQVISVWLEFASCFIDLWFTSSPLAHWRETVSLHYLHHSVHFFINPWSCLGHTSCAVWPMFAKFSV